MQIEPIADDPRGRWLLKNGAGPGVRFDPLSASSMKEACKATGVSRRELMEELARQTTPEEPVSDFGMTIDGAPVPGADPLEALDTACGMEGEFIRWCDRKVLAAVDIDVSQPLLSADVEKLAFATGADRWWLTKSGGGRLMFAADLVCNAEERASAAIVLSDVAWGWQVEKVELLRNTRKPPGHFFSTASARSSNSVLWMMAQVEGTEMSAADLAESTEWLEAAGMELHRRYSHTRCPIDPKPCAGADPVMPLETGVYCFRCANANGDGFRSWGSLIHGRKPGNHPITQAARERTHWPHQKVVFAAEWPEGVVASVARLAYTALLKALGADEAELEAVFNPDWYWLRAEGGVWVAPGEDQLTEEDIKGAHMFCSWAKGSPTRAKRLLNHSRLPGMQEVRPAPFMTRPECLPPGVLPVLARSDIRPHRDDVLPWGEAFGFAERVLPGLCEDYVKALLVACVCAEGGGEVVGLLAAGPSGSGKTSTAMLVGDILGSPHGALRLKVGVEDWRRQLGQGLVAGHRPLITNEVDKIPKFRSHVAKLLDLQDPHRWRPLYGSDINTPWRAPLVLTGINMDPAFGSPELGRRFRLMRLPQKVGNWLGAGVGRWREMGAEYAAAADGMLRWAMDYAKGLEYQWQDCANGLGLPLANEADMEQRVIDDGLMRRLYEHCCSDTRVMSTGSRYTSENGWVDLTSKGAQAVLEPLLGDHDSARFILSKDLEAADWMSLLGRDDPLVFESKVYRAQWVGRFRSPGGRMCNEEA